MNFDLQALIQPSFWFTSRAAELQNTSLISFFILFAVVLVAGAALRVFISVKKDKERHLKIILRRLSHAGLTLGLLGFGWLFMTWQGIPFFGARFWILVWGLSVIVWGAQIGGYTWKVAPILRQQEKDRIEKFKYLPGRS